MALKDTHCEMEVEAVLDGLANTLAEIKAKNILREIE